ncbi:MAG TPA: methionyl-tRNA formyltransferase [candidate division Zixibacteria bacterium]
MHIVFMGTPEFAIPSLEKLLHSRHKVIAVVTGSDKPKGRGQLVCATPVKEYVSKYKIPALCPTDLKADDFFKRLSSLEPELGVVVAFRILPQSIFDLPSKGTINLHASLLPKYRGAAPINWALIKGENKTGLTTFFLQEKVDTGNIILQKEVDILSNETAGELSHRLAELGASLLLETIDLIENGKFELKRQDDSQVSLAPKITKEMCKIDWSKSALQIKNLIRGLSPVPAAYSIFKGKILKVYRAEILNEKSPQAKSGEIIISNRMKSLIVKAKDKALELMEIQLEGKKKMKGEEFIKGCRFQACEKLD